MDSIVIGPKITVLMPVFNGENYLIESIDSILNQTFTDFEFLIVDDGSVDGTFELLEKYTVNDSRVRIHRNFTNQGVANSLNIGLEQARCSLIARMDVDDMALPHRLQTQYEFMQAHPEITVCGSSLQIYEKPESFWKPPVNDEAIKAKMLFECCLYHPTIIFRKEKLIQSNGGYDARFTGAEDYELWQRLSEVSSVRFANLSQPLLRYRMRVDDRSEYKLKQKKIAKLVRRKHLQSLGFYPNDHDFSLHEAFSYLNVQLVMLSDLKAYQEWLDQIENANIKHCIYSLMYLRQELRARWLKLCLRAAYQHPCVSIKFLRCRWSPNSVNSIYHACRMLWRSRRAFNIGIAKG